HHSLPLPPSFPTRRSSDLGAPERLVRVERILDCLRPLRREEFHAHLALLVQPWPCVGTPKYIRRGSGVPSPLVSRPPLRGERLQDRKSTRLNSSHVSISYA